MIDYINVINGDELDLEASFNADYGIVTITQFGLIYQEDSDEDPAEISIHIEDYCYFLEAITSCQEQFVEQEFFTDDINFKVVYSPLEGTDMWEVTMYGQFLVFERQHIDELSRFLTADGRVEGCW